MQSTQAEPPPPPVEEELFREEKKDFLVGDVKLFMCLAMPPPALPVRLTAHGRGGLVGWLVGCLLLCVTAKGVCGDGGLVGCVNESGGCV